MILLLPSDKCMYLISVIRKARITRTTLVDQQLSRTKHAYKITLWDFLRDLGESNVGGAAVIKNSK